MVDMDVVIDPPHMRVEMSLGGSLDGAIEAKYALEEVVSFGGEDVSVVDSHWHGVVLEGPEGETEHVDLREFSDIVDPDE